MRRFIFLIFKTPFQCFFVGSTFTSGRLLVVEPFLTTTTFPSVEISTQRLFLLEIFSSLTFSGWAIFIKGSKKSPGSTTFSSLPISTQCPFFVENLLKTQPLMYICKYRTPQEKPLRPEALHPRTKSRQKPPTNKKLYLAPKEYYQIPSIRKIGPHMLLSLN